MQTRRSKIMTAIGMMSGTSMDGIDLALLRSDGESAVERGPSGFFPYNPQFRRELEAALQDAREIQSREDRPGNLAQVEEKLTALHVDAVKRFLLEQNIAPDDVDLIGFHGQTVLHQPEKALTVQIGDGQRLADETGIHVVYDLRANDMANGGQGAPLVPVYHLALAANIPAEIAARPVAFVNIGGIANITWIGADERLIAFDTGPGNALIDQWVQMTAGIPYDDNGLLAAEGTVLAGMLDRYMENSYFDNAIPKSLDRADFTPPSIDEASPEDGARTLARVTAEAIFRAVEHLPAPPALWIICGGGRRNPKIMADLEEIAGIENGAQVVLAEKCGFDGEAMEAEAWAYLAIRSSVGLPLTFPETTGCAKPVSGGVSVKPSGKA